MNISLLSSRWGRKLGKELAKPPRIPKPTFETNRWNIVKGDLVQVTQGPQTGQRGKVLEVLRKANRIIIEGVNMRSRNVKAKMSGLPGKKVVKPCSLHYSNVQLVDPTTNEPTKIARRYLEDGTKVRVSKTSGQVIPKPDPLANRKPRSVVTGPKDTEAAEVYKVTFTDYEKYLPFIYKTLGLQK